MHRPRRPSWFAIAISAAGLALGSSVTMTKACRAADVDFDRQIRPILQQFCVACHQEDNAEGGLDLTTRDATLAGGDSGTALVPGDPDDSELLIRMTLEADDDLLMPPSDNDGPLPRVLVDRVREWIRQSAVWPDDERLKPQPKKVSAVMTYDDLKLVQKIHAKIVATAKSEGDGPMVAYEAKVPLTGASYAMVPIPAGSFAMGSPPDEADRQGDEGPQTTVQLSPFWMGKYEVTWDEYEPFMITQVDREKHGGRKDYDPEKHTIVDGVSQPTPPYTEMSFGMGQRGFPAISMTQHAANKYCQWLSAQTGHFYRLPTEAEWEYACRAGTKGRYSFPAEQIDRYAWYYDNSNDKYQPVGRKLPNPWGLHDMHGNVMEWTADVYSPDYFRELPPSPKNPFLRPNVLYPRSVRGGSWFDDPEQLRSAYRKGSEEAWKQQDPQLPKSIWYHTDATWLGFRIVRPRDIPSAEEMHLYWNSAAGAK